MSSESAYNHLDQYDYQLQVLLGRPPMVSLYDHRGFLLFHHIQCSNRLFRYQY